MRDPVADALHRHDPTEDPMKRTAPLVIGAIALLMIFVWLGLPRGPQLPEPVAQPQGEAIALATDIPFAMLEIPEDSRNGIAPPTQIPLDGSWRSAGGSAKGMNRYTRPVPFRPRGMFFGRAQPGIELAQADGTPVRYQRGGRGARPTWWHDTTTLTVLVPDSGEPPPLVFSYPRATSRERALNWATARETEESPGFATQADFVRGATVTEGWQSRRGLLLPAPATASFVVTLPEAPVLSMAPGLVRPELSDLGRSDGCHLDVSITAAGSTQSVFSEALTAGSFDIERVDLSAWAGQEVTLTLKTSPGATTLYDYCFVGEPVIAPRKSNPRKVVMVFVDTLRPDHLSLYGHDRPTTPNLTRFAEDAVVFENARSIAPWTLPSARAVVTGRQPEFYDSATTLQARLAAKGFANGMIAGNVYLSANFGMNKDWAYHEVGMFPPANEVTDSALEWLEQHEGQDSVLMVHYMSAHLPYLEPSSYRSMWAGAGPPGLEAEFHLSAVRKARLAQKPQGQQYVRDRYDQCVRWIDDELERLYSQIDDNDILVFFSDHGEEFWDHGGYEHGHTLYEELLRIPLVIKAPGLDPTRVSEPVSILDITPTILELLGESPIEEADGTSLLALARGEPAARSFFEDRDHGFGRPLYGMERWGVIDGTHKWTTSEGLEQVYDLASDPGEQTDLARANPALAEPYRKALGKALGRASGVGYRILPSRSSTRTTPLTATVHIPGGIAEFWDGDDPLERSEVHARRIDPETVEFTWLSGYQGTREAYVLPTRSVEEVTHELVVAVAQGDKRCRLQVPRNLAPRPGRVRRPLAEARLLTGTIRLGWSMAPAPPPGARQLGAMDDEVRQELEALGYQHRDEPSGDAVDSVDLSTVEPCGR